MHTSILHPALAGIEVIERGSPEFELFTRPWSLADDKHPKAVVFPRDEDQLKRTVQYLYGSGLDFAFRGSGCGKSSALDIVVSMRHFTGLEYDAESKTVLVGAGLTTADVDRELQKQAQGRVAVLSRCPYVGVVGSTLTGGLSWLSHELGLGSDPANFLDARIILRDGHAIWARDQPDLLWALRGGGGNFGVISHLRLQTHQYTDKIWSGMVLVPTDRCKIEQVSAAVSTFSKKKDPKMALHVFIVDLSMKAIEGQSPAPQLMLLPFDAHGTRHAESADGFGWLLKIEGVQPMCTEMPIAAVNELQRSSQQGHGRTESWLTAALMPDIDAGFVSRAWSWYHDTINQHPDFAVGTFALLEIMQEPALTSASAESTAWPHCTLGRQHVLQLSTGCVPAPSGQLQRSRIAQDILTAAPSTISGVDHPRGSFLPNFILPWDNVPAVFGHHMERLLIIKSRYDPDNRFNKGLNLFSHA